MFFLPKSPQFSEGRSSSTFGALPLSPHKPATYTPSVWGANPVICEFSRLHLSEFTVTVNVAPKLDCRDRFVNSPGN